MNAFWFALDIFLHSTGVSSLRRGSCFAISPSKSTSESITWMAFRHMRMNGHWAMCTYRLTTLPVAHFKMVVEHMAEWLRIVVECSSHNENRGVVPEPNIRLPGIVLNVEPEL